MSAIFQNVSTRIPKRNNFNLTREVLTSGQIGKIIPIQVEEVVPGDKMKEDIHFLMRFAPMSAPAMVRMSVQFYSFFVPYRILTPQNNSTQSVWEDFVEHIGHSSTSESIPQLPTLYGSSAVSAPPVSLQGLDPVLRMGVGTLWDYMQLPIFAPTASLNFEREQSKDISLMPFLAYQMIYRDFFRRDQLEPVNALPVHVGDGIDVNVSNPITMSFDDEELIALYGDAGLQTDRERQAAFDLLKLREINYERDYFTSALPEPQFGDDVQLAGGLADLSRIVGNINGTFTTTASLYQSNPDGSDESVIMAGPNTNGDSYLSVLEGSSVWNMVQQSRLNPLTLDVTDSDIVVQPFSINELRLAFQLQGIREAINRGGTRFIEISRNIYGFAPSDARLQRPQYLGGAKVPITIGAVLQTSETQVDGTPLGTMAGKAQATGSAHLFKTKHVFDEHGYVVTVMAVRPRTSYFGGIPRKFLKRDPIDFYIPAFDRLGEQQIYNLELSTADMWNPEVDGTSGFGYTPRYAEYKSSVSTVTGEFRTTLDNWHMARSFDEVPGLSHDFIRIDKEDVDRPFEFQTIEGTSNEHFYCQCVIDLVAKRHMSKYSTPLTLM